MGIIRRRCRIFGAGWQMTGNRARPGCRRCERSCRPHRIVRRRRSGSHMPVATPQVGLTHGAVPRRGCPLALTSSHDARTADECKRRTIAAPPETQEGWHPLVQGGLEADDTRWPAGNGDLNADVEVPARLAMPSRYPLVSARLPALAGRALRRIPKDARGGRSHAAPRAEARFDPVAGDKQRWLAPAAIDGRMSLVHQVPARGDF